MKKVYLKPHTKLNIFNYHQTLLNETSPRGAAGGVTEGKDGLPKDVNERTEDDEFNTGGQGTGGGGNRSKAYQVWEY